MSRRVELDIAKYLEQNIDWLTRYSTASQKQIDPTLFIGDLPLPKSASTGSLPIPIRAMSLTEYPGESPQYFLGGGNRRIEKPRLLLTHRARRYDEAQADAYQVHDFLNWKRGVVIDSVPHILIKAVALPSEATPDGQDNAIFTTNFMIWRQFDA